MDAKGLGKRKMQLRGGKRKNAKPLLCAVFI